MKSVTHVRSAESSFGAKSKISKSRNQNGLNFWNFVHSDFFWRFEMNFIKIYLIMPKTRVLLDRSPLFSLLFSNLIWMKIRLSWKNIKFRGLPKIYVKSLGICPWVIYQFERKISFVTQKILTVKRRCQIATQGFGLSLWDNFFLLFKLSVETNQLIQKQKKTLLF